MPKGHKGDGAWYANLLGVSLQESDEAGLFILCICYDSEGPHKLIDDITLGEPKAIDRARESMIPWFKDLRWRQITILRAFPYDACYAVRESSGGQEEPFYASRDFLHGKKSQAGQCRSTARVPVVGQLLQDTTWLLANGLPLKALLL